MLRTAIETEVHEFILAHEDRRDERGQRLVVRNGYKPTREILTGAGPLEVRQPRVRDNSADKEQRVTFSSSILPPYLRRSSKTTRRRHAPAASSGPRVQEVSSTSLS
ncbi:hypothetical protein Pan216_42220 [Planctomycetes bacterium Pan216]|uniref:Transposase, Mutator family n=1 Tax=Kolteria novifilia TaxID=2527975 RepID=A0A518B8N8_9BACT|nr:hypothetical protein Pan216_42220 [Planctomycetes bacterium Pan216]